MDILDSLTTFAQTKRCERPLEVIFFLFDLPMYHFFEIFPAICFNNLNILLFCVFYFANTCNVGPSKDEKVHLNAYNQL